MEGSVAAHFNVWLSSREGDVQNLPVIDFKPATAVPIIDDRTNLSLNDEK
jgi:hypothetical protein